MLEMVETMKRYGYVAMHAAIAATFIFVMQRFAFGATLESALLWAFVFSILAGGLAWTQANR